LKTNAFVRVSEPPHCINPLTVADQRKKLRLVLDLRHVNDFLIKQKFQYENLTTLSDMIEKNFYFGTFDLKSGYHHISIAEEFQTYLGFSWTYGDGTTKHFVFLVLPFGLSTACYVFTKVTRPFVKRWRGFGYISAIYIDDGIVGDTDYVKALRICLLVERDLAASGFVININKTKLTPNTRGKWLGFEIDTVSMEFSVPSHKIEHLLLMISQLIRNNNCSPKQISRVAGHIISMSIAIGPLTQLFTRNMYKFIETRDSWFTRYFLDEELEFELKFWQRALREANGFRILNQPVTTRIVYSDASGTGYGGYIVEKLGERTR